MKPAQDSPYAYVDRQGTLHLPFEDALELATKFCAAEPATVLAGVEASNARTRARPDGQGRNTWFHC